MPQALPPNPLPACPDTPNCERVSRAFDVDTDTLFDRVEMALQSMHPVLLDKDLDARRYQAVFRVWFFKDDVHVAVAPFEGGSVLHIRSASRVGRSDLGVNRRRVNRFFERLAALL